MEEDKNIGGGAVTNSPSVGPSGETTAAQEEMQRKAKDEEHLSNVQKAIRSSNEELRRIREEKRKALASNDESDLPAINREDPSSKAWVREIQKSVAPVADESEREKEEVRTFALREFLADKPALAADPEKLKQMLNTYDRLKSSTEKTREGVLLDLERAYAADHAEEVMNETRRTQIERARNSALFSDAAVSRGTTGYSNDLPTKKTYSEEEKRILDNWELNGAPKID